MSTAAVVVQQPTYPTGSVVNYQAQAPTGSVSATRGLGITQVVIGALAILFGILTLALLHGYWAGHVGFGIWGGAWILIGGILGISSAGNPSNACLNGTNMAFAIVSCVISFIQFIIYCIAAAHFNNYYYYCGTYYYRNCHYKSNTTGVALYVFFLLIMLAEFCVALSVAIFCCKRGCCNGTQTTGVVFQPQTQPTVIYQTSGAQAYPVSSGMPVSYVAPVAYSTQPMGYPNQQMTFVSTTGYAQGANPTAMTYDPSKEAPANAPPPYAN